MLSSQASNQNSMLFPMKNSFSYSVTVKNWVILHEIDLEKLKLNKIKKYKIKVHKKAERQELGKIVQAFM